MAKLIKSELPKVVLIGKEELKGDDLFILNHKYKTDRSEFVLFMRYKDELYINKDLDYREDILNLVSEILKTRFLNNKLEKLLDKFEEYVGEKAANVLLFVWSDWRKERMKYEDIMNVEEMLRNARKKQIHRTAKKHRRKIRDAFDIGFGLYREEDKCDWQQGAENAFMLGYLMGMQKQIEKGCGVS